jgi:O-acetyl-ADP-ribose deacetylase (regulator of RNase III)
MERHVDVIVKAANSYLKHGGSVAAAIVRKVGK